MQRPSLSRFAAVALGILACAMPMDAALAGAAEDFLETLEPAQQQQFKAWRAAKLQHDRKLNAYWRDIEEKRAGRRPKRSSGKLYRPDDYVWTFPPEFKGPFLGDDLDKRWSRFLASRSAKQPEREPMPGVDDFLAAAKKHYGFVPARVSEREFKRRYAKEALALGLSKEQVVRVYALETGGNGTADMQAGVNPLTGKGRPISSALGYAQLLHANTIGELVKSGDGFIARLGRLAAAADDPERKAELQEKAAALQRMVHTARTAVPDDWYRHVAFAQTSRGYGMHAINLDGDIGPWLQTVKLKGLKDFAARKGVTNLSGEEIEIMNLSGPATGLEMMEPVGLTAPTPNFFARKAYYVNKMVNGKTSAELLAEFKRRMDSSVQKPGAVEFAQAFDEVQEAHLPLR